MRRIVGAVLGALGCGAAACAGAGPAGAEPALAPFTIIVTESQTPPVPNSILELAGQLGFYKREGLDVTLKRVAGTPLAVAALLSGEGDMANVSLQAVLKLAGRGNTSLRAVSSPDRSLSYVVVASDRVRSLTELRGKVFGIGQVGTLDNSLTWLVLRRHGLDPGALRTVSVGRPQARLAALAAGKIDATTISLGSWTTLADKSGLRLLISKEDFFHSAPVTAKVNVVSVRTLTERRTAVEKVIMALIKLARWLAADRQRWADAMALARPDLRRADLEQLAAAYGHEWCVDGCFDVETLENSARILMTDPEHERKEPPATVQWADFSIVNSVLHKLGTAHQVGSP
ncbi:MAG TPA: ABC transporter substrate-binding protein [Pseudolabrys sp.]|nr:ABC transporter substrate-binding protein [Pseudolabrys sp.]